MIMLKLVVVCFSIVAVSNALKLHDYGHNHGDHHVQYEHVEFSHHEAVPHHEEESARHHEDDHKHATSHQSVKVHHFHAVPVYIKKEDQHLFKKPVEIGDTNQKLKILHPETQKNHNHGLVLEESSESKFHHIEHHAEPHFEQHFHHHE